jgi:hypothetical protein
MQLAKLFAVLGAAEVRAILVGGVAARAHGAARLTQDVDFVYARDDENLARLATALAPYAPYPRGAPSGLPFEWSASTLRAGLNFTLTTSLGDVDLLGEIVGGGRFEDLLQHAESVEVFGHPLLVLSLEWLIHVKRAAGRPKDYEVIAELEIIREERNH